MNNVASKICSDCKELKSLKDFYKDKTHKDGLQSVCKKCFCKKTNAYKKKNKEKIRKANKDLHLRKTFGITLEEYQEKLRKQRGVCAICGLPETSVYKGKVRHLSVDHNHKTNQVRGLLCNDCNVMLGWAKDETARLLGAIRYLDYWKEQ